MLENGKCATLSEETIYGQKTAKQYLAFVEHTLFSMSIPFQLSFLSHRSERESKVVQEYDNKITKEDVLHYKNILEDVERDGVMIGFADEEARKEAEKYGIEIRMPKPLKIIEL